MHFFIQFKNFCLFTILFIYLNEKAFCFVNNENNLQSANFLPRELPLKKRDLKNSSHFYNLPQVKFFLFYFL
jgi:hypothetical protein